jgi:hypothetical protein
MEIKKVKHIINGTKLMFRFAFSDFPIIVPRVKKTAQIK